MRIYIGRLLLAGLLGALTELAGLALLASATWLLARAAEQPPLAALSVAIVGVRAFALTRGVGRYVERLAGHDAALRLLAELRARSYAALARSGLGASATVGVVPPAQAAQPGLGDSTRVGGEARPDRPGGRTPDLLARLVSDVDAVQDLILRCLLPAGVAVIVSGTAICVAAVILPPAGLVLAAALVLGGLALPSAAHAVARRAGFRSAAARADLTTATVDSVQGAADLIAAGAQAQALAAADAAADRVARLERRTASVQAVLGGLAPLLSVGTAIAVAATAQGRLSGPAAAVVVLGAFAAVEAVTPLTGAAVRFAELRGALARIPRDTGEPEPAPPTADEAHLAGVTVRYPNRDEAALDGVDLDLPPGRRVAIVGPSGAGKSTLLNAIAGAVRATGVYGDRHVFHATVRENLTLGREIPDQALATALRTAGLGDWTERLDDFVGEDGSRLSGGERQRLLLARGLAYAEADAVRVLLLDEPTEGLDPAAADAVLGAVLSAAGDRTVVLVTHRLAPLPQFDEILVLDRGRVLQRGGHDLLLRNEAGWYADEWRTQVTSERRYASARGPVAY